MKLNIYLPCDTAILLPVIKHMLNRKPCARECTAALFITTPKWKQSRYPSTRMKKENVVPSYKRTLLCNKKEQITHLHNNMNQS